MITARGLALVPARARSRSTSASVNPPSPSAPTRRKSRRLTRSQNRRCGPQNVNMDQSSNQVGQQADGGHVAAASGLLTGWALTNYGLSRNSRQQSNDYLVQLARRCQTEKPRI